MKHRILSLSLVSGLLLTACAQTPIDTTALTTSATGPATASAPVRGTPVVAGRPARVFVMVGFKENDCTPLTPALTVTTPPAKGAVSFKPNQTTMVQYSSSGKCTGQSMPGTGIYYTANAGTTGIDTFTVSASTGDGAPVTKTFQVRVVQ